MRLSTLTAISPVDGRYGEKTRELRSRTSEFALIRYRVRVEAAWLEVLAGEPGVPEVQALSDRERETLAGIVDGFDEAAAARVKELEAATNHDVKAVEYYLRERLEADPELASRSGFVHFACTSEDINNLAYALMLREVRRDVLLPLMDELVSDLGDLARRHAGAPMLSRTHGQAATPTTVGKEIANLGARLDRQRRAVAEQSILGKLNGAVGNYNAHLAAYPDVNWPRLGERTVTGLGLDWNPYTTQIEPHDALAEMLHGLARFNTALLDLCRDLWSYVSLGYFRQRPVAGEVGSSTMPHKVNPIDFENAEGNLGLANAILGHLAAKLPISRWQRDLSDSTALRNIGVALAHSVVAWRSVRTGLGKLDLDPGPLARDLDGAWELMAEPIQTVMRRHGVADAYERLKALTRGRAVNADTIREFVLGLDIPEPEKARLLEMSPSSYLGDAERLALAWAGSVGR